MNLELLQQMVIIKLITSKLLLFTHDNTVQICVLINLLASEPKVMFPPSLETNSSESEKRNQADKQTYGTLPSDQKLSLLGLLLFDP